MYCFVQKGNIMLEQYRSCREIYAPSWPCILTPSTCTAGRLRNILKENYCITHRIANIGELTMHTISLFICILKQRCFFWRFHDVIGLLTTYNNCCVEVSFLKKWNNKTGVSTQIHPQSAQNLTKVWVPLATWANWSHVVEHTPGMRISFPPKRYHTGFNFI